ncbi:hypothetical protein Y032_0034g2951 [Ancylostoma ceylanicum]|uniref:Uncharacterized protein n=1 Tax=Ancylostoma ceylanicum TaxID=53326 RepID=A0A016ULT6_9BILA|nr:hypothetical protein Y032_0034g2951 [Ancylostoma ceylanicum]
MIRGTRSLAPTTPTLQLILMHVCHFAIGAYAGLRDGPSSVIHGAPCFMTRSTFDQQMKAIRTSDAGADFGIQPSTLQRYLLIATKLYQTHDDIPLYVASGTMNRMYDRMRILSTSLAIAGFFILFYYCHYANVNRVMRDREAGYMMHS